MCEKTEDLLTAALEMGYPPELATAPLGLDQHLQLLRELLSCLPPGSYRYGIRVVGSVRFGLQRTTISEGSSPPSGST